MQDLSRLFLIKVLHLYARTPRLSNLLGLILINSLTCLQLALNPMNIHLLNKHLLIDFLVNHVAEVGFVLFPLGHAVLSPSLQLNFHISVFLLQKLLFEAITRLFQGSRILARFLDILGLLFVRLVHVAFKHGRLLLELGLQVLFSLHVGYGHWRRLIIDIRVFDKVVRLALQDIL